jgi:hypothetical protein
VLQKLMLKLMLENPDELEVDALSDCGHHPFVDEMQPVVDLKPDAIPVLRADASRIARKFALMGYSMGGRVVDDAVDYLIMELTSKNPDGTMFFQQRDGSMPRHLTRDDIVNIVKNIPVYCFNAPALPMAEDVRAYGKRRIIANSRQDLVSFHFLVSGDTLRPQDFDYSRDPQDQRFRVDGTDDEFGHSPKAALGLDDEAGYFSKSKPLVRALKRELKPSFPEKQREMAFAL